jgi:Beta-lactamase class A
MALHDELKSQHTLKRTFIILLSALCIVEAFFLWLILFPDTEFTHTTADNEYIFDTNEINLDEAAKAAERAERLENWQKFADELAERHADKKYAIAFLSLDDSDFSLEINADQEFIAASTYKLFAAYAMFETGNPPDCLDSMIIQSENECPLEYFEEYGWSRLTKDAHGIGAKNTKFDNELFTTAKDLVTILKQIYDGSLLSETDNSRLLSNMKEQIYREGIPAGIPEAEVANKVGFLDDLLHDAGIIYSPKGNFILVILTDGYLWEAIAETAQEIYINL